MTQELHVRVSVVCVSTNHSFQLSLSTAYTGGRTHYRDDPSAGAPLANIRRVVTGSALGCQIAILPPPCMATNWPARLSTRARLSSKMLRALVKLLCPAPCERAS